MFSVAQLESVDLSQNDLSNDIGIGVGGFLLRLIHFRDKSPSVVDLYDIFGWFPH